jgi:hypothetical protein
VCLAVIVGFAFRRTLMRWQVLTLGGLLALMLVALLSQTWPSYVRSQLPAGLQGRYFFVVLVPLIVLSAVAWRNLIQAGYRRTAGTVLLIVFAGIAAFGVYVELRAVYAGVSDFLVRAPIGAPGVVVLSVLTAALAATAFALALRFVRKAPALVPTPVLSSAE